VTLGGISLPEAFGSELTALMPPPLFAYLHSLIGGDAKHYLFYIILVGQCLVFALAGALYNLRFSPQGERLQWYHGPILAGILWLLTGFVLLPLTGAGIFGAQLSVGLGKGMLSLAEVGLIFGILFIFAQRWLTVWVQERATKVANRKPGDEGEGVSRRYVLKRGAVIVGIGVLGYALWSFIIDSGSTASVPVSRLLKNFKSKIVPPPVPNYGQIQPAPLLSPEVTSNDQFYIVSKNLFADPTVNGSIWQLVVDGQVEHSLTLSYSQLLAMPMKQQYESMMCISNEVGGQYMSNALWEGVPLMDLLQQVGVKPGATKVVFHSADDYSDSIHLSKALEPTTLMAVRMNGVTLPQEHGFPLRMLVPGIYGMKHAKWVTRIEVVNYNFQGYWQQRGWDDAAPIRMTTRIDTPLNGSVLTANRLTYIAGVAFSGNLGISEVDVSTDGGESWQRATLKRPLSNLTWVLWELAWQPKPGNYIVLARAIDMEGNVQDPNVEPPLPKGSSGYHTIMLRAS
jgi:DMSO/TMAO reductase YedYZ molybdopterin-dependent catalytic subunit